MDSAPHRRLVVIGFLVGIAGLAVWLVLQGRAPAYFCAAVLVCMALALRAVQPGRHGLYAAGVAVGVATLVVAVWPTDPGGGYCGSVLNPGQAREAYDSGGDAYSYFKACDRRASVQGMITVAGSAAAGVLLGLSFRRRDGRGSG